MSGQVSVIQGRPYTARMRMRAVIRGSQRFSRRKLLHPVLRRFRGEKRGPATHEIRLQTPNGGDLVLLTLGP